MSIFLDWNTEAAVSADRNGKSSLLGRVIDLFLVGTLPALLIALSLAGGVVALLLTPREEEPQIVVPMADVWSKRPAARRGGRAAGLHAAREAPRPDRRRRIRVLDVAARPFDRDGALLRGRGSRAEPRRDLQQARVQSGSRPPSVTSWVVKPIEIDDVPILIARSTAIARSSSTTSHCAGSRRS